MQKKVILKAAILIFAFFLTGYNAAAQRELKIGIHDNVPLFFVDEQAEVRGISIDIIEYVADREE